jgi:RND superfamily putative drug exporter
MIPVSPLPILRAISTYPTMVPRPLERNTMGPVSRWAVRKPWQALGFWVLLIVLVGVLAGRFAGTLSNSFTLPETDSSRAVEILQDAGFGAEAGGATAKVVWRADDGRAATDPSVAQPVGALLAELAQNPSVGCIIGPYSAPIGTACPAEAAGAQTPPTPEQLAALAALPPEAQQALAGVGPTGVSVDGTTAYATVSFTTNPEDLPPADAKAVLTAVEQADADPALTVGVNGQALEFAGQEPPKSEAIGVLVALIILLFTFGSVVGAFLPILTALFGLGLGLALVTFAARFLDVAVFAPTLAAMIGLGVGIDYSLFVVNRYKQALDAGRDPKSAALESVNTAGRAVVFAAATVIIALLGLFVLGIGFFNGLAVAATVTVIMVMLSATVLLPAVLSLLGRRAFALKMPWARNRTPKPEHASAFARYGRWLSGNYRWAGLLAFLVVVVIALPTTSLRLGFADDSGKSPDAPARIAYDLIAEGFGPGVNGPFFAAAAIDDPADVQAVGQVVGAVQADPGVAAVAWLPPAAGATATAMQIIPTTAPQDEATAELLDRLRGEVIPQAQGDAVEVFIGGTQAITQDFTKVLADALPLFLLVVVGLGFLALVVLFRSLVVPLTGVVTSLLSLGAALGITVAVFQWGWFASFLGINATGPIAPFLPIMVFAILFGLSMDYHVFLVSRMQEEWVHTKDNAAAVRRGLAGSGRVVVIAAAIMTSVFAAFIPTNDATIKLFGIALASAVLIDAFLVRLIIVPSLMNQLGRANWWLPAPLERVLPTIRVESEEDLAYEAAEIADIKEPESIAR